MHDLQTKGAQCPCNVKGTFDVYIEHRMPRLGTTGEPSAQVIVEFKMDSLTHQGHTPNKDLHLCGVESIFPPSALLFCNQVGTDMHCMALEWNETSGGHQRVWLFRCMLVCM